MEKNINEATLPTCFIMTMSMIMSVYDMIYSYTYVYIDVYINRLYSINDKYESSFFYRLIFSYSIIYLPHHTCMNTFISSYCS